MKRICLTANLPGPKNLTSARATAYFDAYGNRLHIMDTERWLDLTDQLSILERQIFRINRDLHLQIESMPQIHEDIQRLCSAPGIDTLTATTVLTETGGLSRFNSPEQLACYSGLTTRTYQSADTVRHGRISKAGPPNLRWALQQSAWVAIRCNPYVRQIYNRISRRAGAKKAATAISRKLLIWLWAMHTHKAYWNKKPPDPKERSCAKSCPLVKKLVIKKVEPVTV